MWNILEKFKFHFYQLHPKLWQGQSQNTNASKGQGFRKDQKGKGVANKGLATKLAQGQPNTMDAEFAQFEALVTSMLAHMKFTTSGLKKAKDRENDKSYGLNANQGFFYGASFLRSMAPNETMPHMLKDH